MNKNKYNISDMVLFYRRNNGLTQKELGRQLGVTHAMISHYENGIHCPSMRVVSSMSELFSVPIGILIQACMDFKED